MINADSEDKESIHYMLQDPKYSFLGSLSKHILNFLLMTILFR